eukprot:TRINITY_DN4493_c0_g1_i1.p1 TRINITY_DN4493_c0_g1~~TRINITY_DN4493_c0_g1_i1.p1  ORF type:complete len:387 (+),score=97.68 TRINITY_DN4493_c0_g1_i1:100-1161(+)
MEVERIVGAVKEQVPWVEKYRPRTLEDIISHKDVIQTVGKMIENKQLPHLLFHGPPGTGKTTTILACCRLLYGGHGHTDRLPPNLVLELNASDDRGISVVREEIKNFAATRNIFGGSFKLVILDEADHLTSDSQAALRRVIEKYTRNVRFCLICNYVNKIIPAIQSRCARFRFGPLEDSDLVIQRLKEIAEAEEMKIDMDALQAVYDLSEGDMRKCVNILQSLCLVHQREKVSFEDVYRVVGRLLPREVEQIVGISMEKPLREAIEEVSDMTIRCGIAVQDLLHAMVPWVWKMEMSSDLQAFAIRKLADLEYRLSIGTTDDIQLSSLISIFQIIRICIAEEKDILQMEHTLLS